MRLLLLLAIFSLSLSSLNSHAADNVKPPLETSIRTLLSDPWRYDGQTVRVRGMISECYKESCRICDTQADLLKLTIDTTGKSSEDDRKSCTGISFESTKWALPWSEDDERYQTAKYKLAGMAMAELRYATATIEASFFGSCVAPRPEPETGYVVFCPAQVSLSYARTIAFHTRRPGTKGIFVRYGTVPLVEANQEEADNLNRAFSEVQFESAESEFRKLADYIFIAQMDVDSEDPENPIEAHGGICECQIESCRDDDWPTLAGQALIDSPLNPYRCWPAIKRDGNWLFPIDFSN